mmetsp:Transcript_4246/g.6165  ORF Transcript_4246/g.6165 Transcript_4246/m.6165 type:complete len:643 (-) Transcript_4246:182-2110(-)
MTKYKHFIGIHIQRQGAQGMNSGKRCGKFTAFVAIKLAATVFLLSDLPICISAFSLKNSPTVSFSNSAASASQIGHCRGTRYSNNVPSVDRSFILGSRWRGECTIALDVSKSSSSTSEKSNKKKKKKLTRPERKALERERKEMALHRNRQRLKHHNNKAYKKDKSPYELHSEAVNCLTKDSTADEVVRAIKRAQNFHDHHDIKNIEKFLIEEVDEHFAYGYRGSLLARLAVAALHMTNHEMARQAIEVRKRDHRAGMLPLESAAIIRGLLRVHNVSDAIEVLNDELSLPLDGTSLEDPFNQDRLKHRALAISSLASRHFYEGEPQMAVRACQMLSQLGPVIRLAKMGPEDVTMPWLRIIQGAAECESKRRDGTVKIDDEASFPCNLVFAVLDAMTTFPSDNNDQVYEALPNALVRRTVFITGAVDMSGLPAADRGEAVFIGRSNVGKSSLVNMVTNRKSLAYTSKRPGKTQQFNYFAVNDKPEKEREIRYGDQVEGEKDADSFYIVDLPGFGFAKVPQQQQREWATFMEAYLANRKTLSVVFHLVDARHGPTDEDERIMKLAGTLLDRKVSYVVVLTKADKNVKGSNKKKKKEGKVSVDVMETLRETMKRSNVSSAPVILTSAETKLGRDDMWRYLRIAAEA